ncbi:glycosyl transferase, group 2 family protein [Nitrobacter sp. Nb-311A]|uniref:glycosyltransferase family 2 protein n=1 Tax=Nitrobacter sp. Nb-311A TaxID=314253 RepID=UPI0000688024|nr:glycosyltransferase family 2 protein [Nitrobacter sp. Nb-311A]EAQ33843.1 glycosyl transferase, group 2 family protein [Nitrobacter sp. Nb-311A]
MKLLVVIVNYRITNLAIDCLHSVAKEIERVPNTQVAICENGTGDDSADRIQSTIAEHGWASWCTLKTLEINLGFTGGNNAILRPAMNSADAPDYILLLNSDTIVRPNAFKELIDFMDNNPKVGIAGSRLENPDGTPQRSAFRFQSPFGEFESCVKLGLVSKLLSRWVVAPPVENQPFATDWVSGASMIIRREAMQITGLLDEGYYTYFDDIDYCFNAGKRGWPTWYVPASRVVHLVSQSTGVNRRLKRLPPYLLEARRRYFLKNHGPLYAALVDICRIAGLSLWRLRILLTRKEDTTPPKHLSDSIRHSVFFKGFRVTDVDNPLLSARSN